MTRGIVARPYPLLGRSTHLGRRVNIRDFTDDPADCAALQALFWEYLQCGNAHNARELGVRFDIAAMLDDDMRTLHKFGPPGGCILLADDAGAPVCVGCLRRLDPGTCEIKRLYVRPEARGAGVGRALLDGLLARARDAGYARVRLDSAAYMARAHAVYRAAGFREIPAYAGSEIPGAFWERWVFMERGV